jgi:hypothetical protein
LIALALSTGPGRIRTTVDFVSKTPVYQNPPEKRTESGTVDGENTPKDPELALIVERWPKLPEHIKAAVLALVRTSAENKSGD